VEIDRSIYMDEGRVVQNADFKDVKSRLAAVIAEIAQIGQGQIPLAAE
jgi:N-formylglutamate deformylase